MYEVIGFPGRSKWLSLRVFKILSTFLRHPPVNRRFSTSVKLITQASPSMADCLPWKNIRKWDLEKSMTILDSLLNILSMWNGNLPANSDILWIIDQNLQILLQQLDLGGARECVGGANVQHFLATLLHIWKKVWFAPHIYPLFLIWLQKYLPPFWECLDRHFCRKLGLLRFEISTWFFWHLDILMPLWIQPKVTWIAFCHH